MLTGEQVAQYSRDGYTVCEGLLTQAEVAALLSDAESICAGNTLAHHDKAHMEMEPDQPPDGTLVRRLYEPCTCYPKFRALSESAQLLDCVEQLLGPNLVFHYSKLNMKPAAFGSVVEWHQDLAYYPLTNRDSLAVLLYLDDANLNNGCLQIIPGLHQAPLMNHTLEGFFQGMITEPVNESLAAPVEGRAGTAIFMHCMAPHASAPNRSDRPRRTLILSYRAADAYPIYFGETTVHSAEHVRLVRGKLSAVARFTMAEFPIPTSRKQYASLYELQRAAREEQDKQ